MSGGSAEKRLSDAALRSVLAEVLGTDDQQALEAVGRRVAWVDLPSGGTLYRQGDPADSVHVLLRGRLRAIAEGLRGAPRVIGEIGRGETVGEMALIAGGVRTATVLAVRDSVLLGLSRAAVEEVMTLHPPLALAVARLSVDRMRRALHGHRRPSPARCVALVAHRRVSGLRDLAERLAAGLAPPGRGFVVDAPPAMRGPATVPSRWLDEQESESDALVLVTDPTPTEWTAACLRHADVVLIVAEAGDDPSPGEVERAIPPAAHGPSRLLVLVHGEGVRLPAGTADWLDARPDARHHHLRAGRPGDVSRLVRFLTGRAVGLVLAGGGAPGLVHVGVVRALRERGVPIDAVAGTSIGAIVAAAVARDWDDEALAREAKAAFSNPDPLGDWNLVPVASLSRGRRMEARLRASFGDAEIEDLWLPFFCVSADLSASEEHVHRRGPVWRALRTSASIPGVLPPVVHGDHLHVDGSCVNNLPVDAMIDAGVGLIVASDLDLRVDRELGYEEVPSSWAILRGRFVPGARRYPVPGMVGVVMKSTMLGGVQRAGLARDGADLVFVPPVARVGLLDWQAFDRVVDIGYRYASERLARVDPVTLEETPPIARE